MLKKEDKTMSLKEIIEATKDIEEEETSKEEQS